MFITSIPASAMQTVPPANSTARPEVLSDWTADSSRVQAPLDAAPVPGHDEQRVVDADAEPDQRAEQRGDFGHVP